MVAAGANLRELMERMGHSSSRAALIYLHSTDERQRTLADAVASQAQAELAGSRGTTWADGRVMIAGWPSGTPADLGYKRGAPGASRTRDLLLRRHTGPSAAHTSEDARHQQAKPRQAVAA